MGKLDLKDIAKYLPYKVEYICDDKEKSGCLDYYGRKGLLNPLMIEFILASRYKKPILRPLSQLTQEIEHRGKKFVPVVELAKMDFRLQNGREAFSVRLNNNVCLITPDGEYGIIIKFRYSIQDSSFYAIVYNNDNVNELTVAGQLQLFEKLYEWHFWLGDQSYFEKGLLIEKK